MNTFIAPGLGDQLTTSRYSVSPIDYHSMSAESLVYVIQQMYKSDSLDDWRALCDAFRMGSPHDVVDIVAEWAEHNIHLGDYND